MTHFVELFIYHTYSPIDTYIREGFLKLQIVQSSAQNLLIWMLKFKKNILKMSDVISNQPLSNGTNHDLPPYYDEAEEERKKEEQRREQLRTLDEETAEDCCCYIPDDDDTFCCLWLLSRSCRCIGECTNDCFECLAESCNNCCNDTGESASVASFSGNCCDCDCDCSD